MMGIGLPHVRKHEAPERPSSLGGARAPAASSLCGRAARAWGGPPLPHPCPESHWRAHSARALSHTQRTQLCPLQRTPQRAPALKGTCGRQRCGWELWPRPCHTLIADVGHVSRAFRPPGSDRLMGRKPWPCLLRASARGLLQRARGVLSMVEVVSTPCLTPAPRALARTCRIFASCFCESTTMMLARQSWAMYWQASGELVV